MFKKPCRCWPIVIGDVVELRSGSPDLLVLHVEGGWAWDPDKRPCRQFRAAATVAWRNPQTGAIHESVEPTGLLKVVRQTRRCPP